MSDNFFRVNKGITLNPSDAPTAPQEGQIYHDASDSKTKISGAIQAIDPSDISNSVEINPIPETVGGKTFTTISSLATDGIQYKANPTSTLTSHSFYSHNSPIMNIEYGAVELLPPDGTGSSFLRFTYNNGLFGNVDLIPDYTTSGNSTTLFLPTSFSGLDILVARSSTDTFENKTYDTAAIGNVFKINGTQLTDVTGTGSVVLDTSPTLTTPNLGTPSSIDLTNGTNLPVSTGISGLGTNVATFLVTPTSANLAAAITDETGTAGSLVFSTSPVFTTPNIDSATATSVTGPVGADLVLNSATGHNVVLKNENNTTATISSTGVDLASGKYLKFADNSNVVTIKPNASTSATYDITLPAAAPNIHEVFQYDGSNFHWSNTFTNATINTSIFDIIYGSNLGDLIINPDSTTSLYIKTTGTSNVIIGDITASTIIIDTVNTPIPTIRSESSIQIESNSAGVAGSIIIDANELFLKENGSTYISLNTSGIELVSNLDNSSKYLLFIANSNAVTVKASSALSATYDLILPDAAPTTDYLMGYNGAKLDWFKFVPSVSTNSALSGASPTVTINTSTLDLNQVIVVSGASAAVTLSTTPFGSTAPVSDGTIIRLVGGSNTNTVTMVNSDIAKGAVINGTATLGLYNSITLQYISSLDRYIEISRNF